MLENEIGKYIVGQEQMVNLLIIALLADGHVLIEGVPGIAKTITARIMARTIDADFKRIKVSWGSLKELHSFDGLTYIKLIKNFREMEQFKDADDAYYQYRRQSQENKKWSLSKLSDRFMQLSCGYGVKPWRTAAWAVAIVLVFTPFYFWRGGIKRLKENNEVEKQDVSLYDAFYFSMTTFTTLGYGDLYPADRYRMVAVMIEGLVGWLILALFLVTLANVMIRP